MLDNALDCGLTEFQFWDMTIAEITRHCESKRRMLKAQQQERAVFDYILANLISQNVAVCFSGKDTKRLDISEVYPTLFEDRQAEVDNRKTQLSVQRFIEYATAHNKKYKKEVS